MLLTAGILLLGGVYVLTILDPYSTFGRFMTYFAKPAVLFVNNLSPHSWGNLTFIHLYRVDIKAYELAAYIIPPSFLLLIGFLAFRYGRLYCNTVCPVGTFLGLLSKTLSFQDQV